MRIKQQMEIANEVLTKLETFDPTCILAGGAPRDWYMGKPATDLDFYIYFRPELSMRYLESIFKDLGFNLTAKELSNPEIPMNYKHNPHLKRVYEQFYSGIKIQIMQMDMPTFSCVVNLFPLDICMIWYKHSQIFPTKEFMNCIRTHTIHLMNELYNRKDKYLDKIRKKFPGFKWSKRRK